jgi:mercuric ion transport protein
MQAQDGADARVSARPDAMAPPDSTRRHGLIAAGGLLGAVAASSCCILPLALFSAGVGSVWIGNLTALSPYQPYFVAMTLGFLIAGFYRVYRKPSATACDATGQCGTPVSMRITKSALWMSVALVLAAVAFPYYMPLLLGS